MRNIFFTLIILSLLFGCQSKSKEINAKTIKYNQFILNVAFNNPEYTTIHYKTNEEYQLIEEIILRKQNEVTDFDLGLYMSLHKWTLDGGQSFPKSIIYINNNKEFEYAFPFYDEYYYWKIYSNQLNNPSLKQEFENNMTFNKQINYIVSKLGLNHPEKKKELNQFITLLADSLLGMNELSLYDISSLDDDNNESLPFHNPKSELCTKHFNQNIKDIAYFLVKENVRLFNCTEGFNAFWKFETKPDKVGNNRINISFENKECYYSIYY